MADPIFAPLSFGSTPEPPGGGDGASVIDPIISSLSFGKIYTPTPALITASVVDPMLGAFFFGKLYSPPVFYPDASVLDPMFSFYSMGKIGPPIPPYKSDDFIEAVAYYLNQNFSETDLPGGVHYLGFKQNNTKWPGIAFWLISNNESRTWDSGPQEFPRLQFNLCGTNEKQIRELARKFKRLMRLVKFPNRLFFQGGEASQAMLSLETMMPEDDRIGPGSARIRGTILDYVFTVDYDED